MPGHPVRVDIPGDGGSHGVHVRLRLHQRQPRQTFQGHRHERQRLRRPRGGCRQLPLRLLLQPHHSRPHQPILRRRLSFLLQWRPYHAELLRTVLLQLRPDHPIQRILLRQPFLHFHHNRLRNHLADQPGVRADDHRLQQRLRELRIDLQLLPIAGGLQRVHNGHLECKYWVR